MCGFFGALAAFSLAQASFEKALKVDFKPTCDSVSIDLTGRFKRSGGHFISFSQTLDGRLCVQTSASPIPECGNRFLEEEVITNSEGKIVGRLVAHKNRVAVFSVDETGESDFQKTYLLMEFNGPRSRLLSVHEGESPNPTNSSTKPWTGIASRTANAE